MLAHVDLEISILQYGDEGNLDDAGKEGRGQGVDISLYCIVL